MPRCALKVGQASQGVFSTRLRVLAEAWVLGCMRGKSRTAEQTNQQLDKIRSSAETALCELSGIRQRVTADDVRYKLLGLASEDQMPRPTSAPIMTPIESVSGSIVLKGQQKPITTLLSGLLNS